MTVPIREAAASDSACLLDLISEHVAYERAESVLTHNDLEGILRRSPERVYILVAEDQGTLVGYAALTVDYSLWQAAHYAHLDCLFVREAMRGRGIGSALFTRVCEWTRQCGMKRLEWQTPDWNHDAVRFYERHGGVASEKVRFHRSVSAGV